MQAAFYLRRPPTAGSWAGGAAAKASAWARCEGPTRGCAEPRPSTIRRQPGRVARCVKRRSGISALGLWCAGIARPGAAHAGIALRGLADPRRAGLVPPPATAVLSARSLLVLCGAASRLPEGLTLLRQDGVLGPSRCATSPHRAGRSAADSRHHLGDLPVVRDGSDVKAPLPSLHPLPPGSVPSCSTGADATSPPRTTGPVGISAMEAFTQVDLVLPAG